MTDIYTSMLTGYDVPTLIESMFYISNSSLVLSTCYNRLPLWWVDHFAYMFISSRPDSLNVLVCAICLQMLTIGYSSDFVGMSDYALQERILFDVSWCFL